MLQRMHAIHNRSVSRFRDAEALRLVRGECCHRVQVSVNTAEGLKHESAIQCDGLMSLEKSRLTDYVGELASDRLRELDSALLPALGLPTRTRTPT